MVAAALRKTYKAVGSEVKWYKGLNSLLIDSTVEQVNLIKLPPTKQFTHSPTEKTCTSRPTADLPTLLSHLNFMPPPDQPSLAYHCLNYIPLLCGLSVRKDFVVRTSPSNKEMSYLAVYLTLLKRKIITHQLWLQYNCVISSTPRPSADFSSLPPPSCGEWSCRECSRPNLFSRAISSLWM